MESKASIGISYTDQFSNVAVERDALDKVYELVNRTKEMEGKHNQLSIELAETELKLTLLRKELLDWMKTDEQSIVILRIAATQANNLIGQIPQPDESESWNRHR